MTLDELIKSYLGEEGQMTLHGYDMYRERLLDGLADIGWDTSLPIVKKLDVPTSKVINLPSSVIKVLKCGIQVADQIIPLQKNNNLSRVDVDDCGDLVSTGSNPVGFEPPSPLAPHYRIGQNVGGYYNAGSQPTIGSYKLWPDGFLQLSSDYPYNYLYVEFLGRITDTTPDANIPEHLIEPLKAWIEWTLKRRKRNVSRNEIAMLKNNYIVAKRTAIRRQQGFLPADMVAASRSGISQAPKM